MDDQIDAQVSSFMDRKIKSRNWGMLAKYLNISYVDIINRPHSDRFMVVIACIFVLLGQLSILVIPPTSSRGHTWVYNTLQSQITVGGLVADHSEYVLLVLMTFLISKVVLVCWMAYRNSCEHYPSELTRSISNLLISFLFMQVTILNMPIVDVCIHVVILKHVIYKVIAVVVLVSFPFELVLHNVLTFDFEYVRQNAMQGRCYRYLLVKSTLAWVLCIVFYAVHYSPTKDTESVSVILNLANCCAATLILLVRIRNQTLFFSRLVNSITLLADSIYLWQSLVFFVRSFSPGRWSFVDLDYAFLLMVPLTYFLMKQLDSFALVSVLNYCTHLPKSRKAALLYVEALYDCFCHERVGQNRLHLFNSTVAHTKRCNDPYCLCFNLLYYFDKIVGPEAVKSSHELYKHFYLEKKGHRSTSLSMFADLSTIESMKAAHIGTIAAHQDQTSKTIDINKLATNDSSTVGSLVNIDSSEHFILMMSSLLRDITNHYSSSI